MAPPIKPQNQEITNLYQQTKPTKFAKPEIGDKKKPKCGSTKPLDSSQISDHHQNQPEKNPICKKIENLPPAKSFGKTPFKICLKQEKFVTPQTSKQVQAGAKEKESQQNISNFWRENFSSNHNGDRNQPGPSSDPIGRRQTSQKTQD